MKDHRTARFTSSKIHCLVKKGTSVGFSAAGLTYIKNKALEYKLGRSMDTFAYSQAIAWGNIMEKLLYEIHLKDMDDYSLISSDYRLHPDPELSAHWSGVPDLEITGKLVSEIKCYQLEKFAKYADCLMKKSVDLLRCDFDQEYWQIVSNACINGVTQGEAVVYMPYREELEKIQDIIENTDLLERYSFEPWQFRFITERHVEDLPYIELGGYFNNVTRFRFDIPKKDIELLTSRVKEAKNLFNNLIKIK